jgi:ABC-2 type transport system permease protein
MFDNTLKLTKFMLKRERTTSTAWILTMVILNFLILLLMGVTLMPEASDMAEFMLMMENPVMLAMVGPLYSPDIVTMGALYTLMMFVFMGIAVGIMNIFLVVRHTRADEELGRYEVLRSLPCGRLASVNAAMITAVVVNAVMAVLFALSMWLGAHIIGDPMGFEAALLWGVGLAAVGLAFGGVAAFFSQLSSSSRGALSYSFLTMGLFYLLRAGADMDPDALGFLAFLSPLGLMSRTWVYINNVWWPVLVILGYAGGFTALAYWLCGVRDIDQGIIPARPGKAHGGFLLKSALGLNGRLLRTSIIGWVVILFVTGLSYSAVLQDIDNFVAGNDMYRQLMLGPTGLLDYIQVEGMTTEQIAAQINAVLNTAGLSIVQLFANMIGFVMAMIATVPVILFVLKAKSEEKNGRAELIFATPTSRVKYLVGLVAIAFVSAALIQAAQAMGLYLPASAALDNPADLPLRFVLESALVYVPAMLVMGGIATLLVGLLPRCTGLIWAYYAFAFFVMLFGRMMTQTAWLANFTPFGWVPQLPMDEINWPVMVVLKLIGLGLAAVGIYFYNKRDINAVTQ